MNDFFIHQAVQKNNKAIDEFNLHLKDLKVLTNGDLAKQASVDLKATSEQLSIDFRKASEKMSQDVTVYRNLISTLCVDLHDSRDQLNRLIFKGWILLGAFFFIGIGILCYVAFYSH